MDRWPGYDDDVLDGRVQCNWRDDIAFTIGFVKMRVEIAYVLGSKGCRYGGWRRRHNGWGRRGSLLFAMLFIFSCTDTIIVHTPRNIAIITFSIRLGSQSIRMRFERGFDVFFGRYAVRRFRRTEDRCERDSKRRTRMLRAFCMLSMRVLVAVNCALAASMST